MNRIFFCLAVVPLSLMMALSAAVAQDDTPAPETAMSPAEFEAFAAGKTLYFERHGAPYGAERYTKDRRVIWTFLDGRCERVRGIVRAR